MPQPLAPSPDRSPSASPETPSPAAPPARWLNPTAGPWLQIGSCRGFQWNQWQLPIPSLPPSLSGLRILHLTDTHLRKAWDAGYDDFLARLKNHPPDLILFTGDFVEDKYCPRVAVDTVRRLFSQLTARLGIFSILGNHDGDLLTLHLEDLPITFINDSRLLLNSGSSAIELIGLPGVDRTDLDHSTLLKNLPPRQPHTLRIILSHFPDQWHACRPHSPDLYLAGHTHGGQVCLPTGRPILRHDSLPHRLCRGIHRLDNSWFIVNRGLGFGKYRLRLFCPAEVMELELVEGL